MKSSSIITVISFFALSALSWGAAVTWNFATPNGNQGATHTYIGSDNTSTITAAAFSWSGGTLSLFGKNTNDTGLGIAPHGDHNTLSVHDEIDTTDYIQLGLANAGSGVLSLTMTSVEGDSFDIYGVGPKGLTLLIAHSTLENTPFNISQYGYKTIDITAHSGDVLLGSASESVSPTPEPATFALAGVAFTVLGLIRRRRRTE
jgi:hypothetical protein